MKAMILCAGKGTRLRPLTLTEPKPMIPLIDKPVLQYIIEHLKNNGVSDVAINLSYLPEKIVDYFRDGAAHDVGIFYSYEGTITENKFVGEAIGSAGGMNKIQNEHEFFDDTFLVLCGDAAINVDLKKVIAEHKKRNALATVVLKDVPREKVNKYGVVCLDGEGRISEFQEKPEVADALSTTVNTGIYIFEPEIFNYIEDGVVGDFGMDLFPLLTAESDRFFGTVQEFDWLDIGDLDDFKTATNTLLESEIDGLVVPGKELAPGLRVGSNVFLDLETIHVEGDVYVGSGSTIAPGAKLLGPCVIGQNCRIGKNAIVRRTILGSDVRVSQNALIDELTVFKKHAINAKGQTRHIHQRDGLSDARSSSATNEQSDIEPLLEVANLRKAV